MYNSKIQALSCNLTSMMSSGNKKMEQPSFRATLIIYVAFNLFSSSTIITTKTVSPLLP